MVEAKELVNKYEGWLEAAETGDFSDVNLPKNNGGSTPSPVVQLAVYEEDNELKIDEGVFLNYQKQNQDLSYRNLQQLAGRAGVNPIGKTYEELFDLVKLSYEAAEDSSNNSEQLVGAFFNEDIGDEGFNNILEVMHEEGIETEFEKLAKENLINEGINGREKIRTMIDEFKKESNYQEEDNRVITFGKDSSSKGDNIMTEVNELEDKLNELESYIVELGEHYRESDENIEDINSTVSQIEDTYSDIVSKVSHIEGIAENAGARVEEVYSKLENADELLEETYETIDYFADSLDAVSSNAEEVSNRLEETSERIEGVSEDLESLSSRGVPSIDLPEGIDELVDKYGDEETQEAVEGIRSIREESEE